MSCLYYENIEETVISLVSGKVRDNLNGKVRDNLKNILKKHQSNKEKTQSNIYLVKILIKAKKSKNHYIYIALTKLYMAENRNNVLTLIPLIGKKRIWKLLLFICSE